MGFMSGAGGFAKGFGDAFANSYDAGLERKARKEAQAEQREYDKTTRAGEFQNDIFKLNLAQSMKDKETLRDQKKKESGYASQAEALARANGGDAKDYYGKLSSGMTYSEVDSYASSIDWKSPDASAPVAAPSTGMAPGNTNQQTSSAMPGLDEEYAGATPEQMSAAGFEPSATPSVAPSNEPAPMPVAPQVKPDVSTEGGYTGTRKVKATPMMSLTDRLQQALAANPNSEEAKDLAAKVRTYNEITRVSLPEKADLDNDYQAALKGGDPKVIAEAEDRLKKYKETTEKNDPQKASATARLEAAIAGGNREEIAKAAEDVKLLKSVTEPDKAAKVDLQADYDNALKTGNTDEIARTKALLDQSEATKNANRPKPVGRTTVDLQNELTLATTPDERARIQSAIDSAAGSEYSSKVLSEGPKQGMWVDKAGNFQPGSVTPERGPDGKIVWKGTDGTAGARPFVPGEDEAVTEYFKLAQSGEAKEHREKVADIASAYRSGARVNQILSENSDILAGGTGAVTKFISDMAGELRAAGNLLNVEVKTNSDGSIDASSMVALEDKLKGINIKDIEDDASKRAIFNAEMATMVFRAGAALGQTGAAFGAKDQALVRQIVGADASKGETAQTIIGNYLENARRRVDDGGNLINQQAETQFKGQWGWVPPKKIVPTVDELIESNPDDELLNRGRTLGASEAKPTTEQSTQKTSSGVTWRIK